MKILFYGDSITDMNRFREIQDHKAFGYGMGYPLFIAGELRCENPEKYQIVNRGIGGNRIVDLYARIKVDMWNHAPDVLSILIGVNDIWHELDGDNGVDIERFDRIYRMMIEDTLARFPDMKIILCEPFLTEGSCTTGRDEFFAQVKAYAEVVKKIAEDYGLYFLPLQAKLDEVVNKFGAEYYVYDGVHPSAAGARLIANEWLKLFRAEIDK